MSYADWIKTNLPQYQVATSDIIEDLIQQAKQQTRLMRFSIVLVYATSLTLCSFYWADLMMQGVVPDNNCISISVILILVLTLSLIQQKVSSWILCKELFKIARNNI